jgi:hypothetical protein
MQPPPQTITKEAFKMKAHLSIILLFSWVWFNGCSTDKTGIGADQMAANLVKNPSFENNPSEFFEHFKLESWEVLIEDSAFINLVKDAPANGGQYAVRLTADWVSPAYIFQHIPLDAGTHRLQMSVTGKTKDLAGVGGVPCGTVAIFVRNGQDQPHYKAEIFGHNENWTTLTLLDTVTINSGDSLFVGLRGCIGQFNGGYVLYDNVTLREIQ